MKKYLVKYFPFLGKYKRWLKIYIDSCLKTKQYYGQYGEDKIIMQLIKKYQLSNYPYIDVGANHPSDISNTYLLYRKGLSGFIIEPNEELLNLHKQFRKSDSHLCIGCSNTNSVLKFNISKTPVLSSFQTNLNNFYFSKMVPLLTLDTIFKNQTIEQFSFLNIDVEGMTTNVLEGALQMLHKVGILCIEFDDEIEKEQIQNLLIELFVLHQQVGCNLIFINKKIQ